MTAARRDAPQPRQAPREMKHSKKTQRPLPPHHLTKEVEVGEKKDRRMTPIGRRRTGDRKTTARRIRKTGRGRQRGRRNGERTNRSKRKS